MGHVTRLGLSALAISVVVACLWAPNASATWQCLSGGSPCAATITATSADSSGSGSTSVQLVVAAGLVTLTCNDSTLSSEASSPVTSGLSSITTTGGSVDFTTCRVSIDAGCSVTMVPTRGDSRWTVTLSSPSGGGPSYALGMSVGTTTVTLRTCTSSSVNGTVTMAGQSLGTTCARYTLPEGILRLTRCSVAYTASGNVAGLIGASGTAALNVSYHATIDGTAGASLGVDSAPASPVKLAPASTRVVIAATPPTSTNRILITVPGIATGTFDIRCSGHTMSTTTGASSNSFQVAAAANAYSDSRSGATSCPTDAPAVTATISVRCTWTVTAGTYGPGAALANVRIDSDRCIDIRLDGAPYNCTLTVNRSAMVYTVTWITTGSVTTDNPNRVSAVGDRGACTRVGSLTMREDLASAPTFYFTGPLTGPVMDFAGAFGRGVTMSTTVTNGGVSTRKPDSLTLTGPGGVDYQVTTDRCSGTPVVPRGTCSITIEHLTTRSGAAVAWLDILNGSGTWLTSIEVRP